ncbi:MAG: TIR domain-containing protein [Gemmatimonadales bacterium]
MRTIRTAFRMMSDPTVAGPLYHLGAEVLSGEGKTDMAVALLKEGIKVIPASKNLFVLYQGCAELLGRTGKVEAAVSLLKEGIKVIPAEMNLFALYQSCAELLAHSGKLEEAVALLKEGIQVIPADKSLISLYQLLGNVLCRAGKPLEAVATQIEGMGRIPDKSYGWKMAEAALLLCAGVGKSDQFASILSAASAAALSDRLTSLAGVLECQGRGDWIAAAERARVARIEFPRYFALVALEALSRLAGGDAEGARRCLFTFSGLVFGTAAPHGWLLALIQLRRGLRSEASIALAQYVGRPVDESRELNETFLLRLWDQQEVSPESNRLCYHFPIMPASLTGLAHPVCRAPFAEPVLPPAATAPQPGKSPATAFARVAMPDTYVSYAWGEDSTEAGRRREEIVNQLCAAVEASGRVIGRDKDRLRGGDSIERFAHEISKAKRIVAIISEKSLNSPYCMAHELFRAFRRCDYQRAEFQEKVIALVMDDAKPLLKDPLSVVALAKAWQERFETLRAELQSVDPTRKSADLWVFVDMMEDMCPRLPAMLGALVDIVMKRGFDEIVDDGFREVIALLPPKSAA